MKKGQSWGFFRQEKEIAEWVLAGLLNKEIEKELFISQHTVQTNFYRMYQNAGVKSRAQFMHLLHPPPENEKDSD